MRRALQKASARYWLVRTAGAIGGLLAFLSASATLAQPELLLASGETETAELIAVANDSGTFRLDDGERIVAWRDVVRWGRPSEPVSHRILLSDGSRIPFEGLRVRDGRVELSGTPLGDLAFAPERIRAVGWQRTPGMPDNLLDQLTTEIEPGADRVVLVDGDTLRGRLIWTSPEQEEVPGEAVLRMRTAGSELRIPLRQVRAVVLDPSLVQSLSTDEPRLVVDLSDGSRLVASRWEASGDGRLLIDLAGGERLTLAEDRDGAPGPRICFVQPLGYGIVYVSDLEWYGYRHEPFFSLQRPLAVNRSLEGGPLRDEDRIYLKGLGMPSRSRLAVDIPPGFQRFDAELCVDAAADHRGSVVFRVYTQRSAAAAWEIAWESGIVRRGSETVSMRVDIRDVQRLVLMVDYADFGDTGDLADWLEPRLIPVNR